VPVPLFGRCRGQETITRLGHILHRATIHSGRGAPPQPAPSQGQLVHPAALAPCAGRPRGGPKAEIIKPVRVSWGEAVPRPAHHCFTSRMELTLRYAVASDVGQRREANEDSVYASPHLLAVADGMGGHVAGEVASQAAVTAISELDKRLTADADPLEELFGAVREAVSRLTSLAEEDPALRGMGTTLTTLHWDGSRFAVAHVGDSRAYLLREGELEQITRDHTVVQELVDQGRITPEVAASHPSRSVLTRALQSGGEADPDLFFLEARPADRYLICSDGLSDVVPSDAIREVLAAEAGPEQAAQRLIELANAGGGPDNITCVIADVLEQNGAE
jgi:PPM family protein phosphatase